MTHTKRPSQRNTAAYLTGLKSILKDRERELLQLKGPCRVPECDLHYEHVGPCRIKKQGDK